MKENFSSIVPLIVDKSKQLNEFLENNTCVALTAYKDNTERINQEYQ